MINPWHLKHGVKHKIDIRFQLEADLTPGAQPGPDGDAFHAREIHRSVKVKTETARRAAMLNLWQRRKVSAPVA